MERWTRFVLRHRWFVLGAWIVVVLGSFAASRSLGDLLTNRFTLPGTDTHRVELLLQDHFGQRSTGSFSLVAKTDGAPVEPLLPALERAGRRATAVVPTAKLVQVMPVSADVATATIVSKLEPADAKGYTDDVRRAV